MRIKIEREIKPFQVPNFVVIVTEPKPRQEGFHPENSIPLSDLDASTLWKLCDDFKDSVFRKAGKAQPPMKAPK